MIKLPTDILFLLLPTAAVNSTNLYKAGSTATYTVKLTNGAVPIPTTDLLSLVPSATAPGAISSCFVGTDTTNVPMPRAGLAEYATLTCTIVRTVTTADITAAALPAFNITASVTPTGGNATQIAAVDVAAIPLFTGLPCINCRTCLSKMTTFINGLLNVTDAAMVASKFNAECKMTYNGALCDALTNQTLASPTAFFAKRAGNICKRLGQCETQQFETDCSLATAPLVPAGSLDVCSVTGTNGYTTLVVPNAVANTSVVAKGFCFTDANCDSTQVCTNATAGWQCGCNNVTGAETCVPFAQCVNSPCTNCRNCLASMRTFTNTWGSRTVATTGTEVAAAFRTHCASIGRPLAICSEVALRIEASFQGNLGKRAGWLCQAINECPNPTTLPANCTLAPNTTVNSSRLTPADFSMCSVDGASFGKDVAGIAAAANATRPNNTCVIDSDCQTSNATANFTCSFAAGTQFCYCNATSGQDVCSDIGVCKGATVASCQSCLTAVNSFVQQQMAVKDAAAVATAFAARCASLLGEPADCAAAAEAIRTSPYGNIGKRAANLCSRIFSESVLCSLANFRTTTMLLKWP
jgi:hypothetical protein